MSARRSPFRRIFDGTRTGFLLERSGHTLVALFALAFVTFVFPLVLLTFTPWVVLFSIVAGVAMVVQGRAGGEVAAVNRTELRDLPRILVVSGLVIPAFYSALFAPLRGLLCLLTARVRPPADSLGAVLGWASPIDLYVGACGVAFALCWLLHDAPWRLRVLRQLRLLPASSAGSAAVGVVELRGIARSAGGRPGEKLIRSGPPGERMDRFVLEDGSGRIRVDPAGHVRGAGLLTERIERVWTAARDRDWLAAWRAPVSDLVLVRRFRPAVLGKAERRALCDGDPVYVLGTATIDDAAAPAAVGSDRLIVRRAPMSRPPAAWQRFFDDRSGRPAHPLEGVFYLSDTPEIDARRHMRRALALNALLAGLWGGLSATLFILALS